MSSFLPRARVVCVRQVGCMPEEWEPGGRRHRVRPPDASAPLRRSLGVVNSVYHRRGATNPRRPDRERRMCRAAGLSPGASRHSPDWTDDLRKVPGVTIVKRSDGGHRSADRLQLPGWLADRPRRVAPHRCGRSLLRPREPAPVRRCHRGDTSSANSSRKPSTFARDRPIPTSNDNGKPVVRQGRKARGLEMVKIARLPNRIAVVDLDLSGERLSQVPPRDTDAGTRPPALSKSAGPRITVWRR